MVKQIPVQVLICLMLSATCVSTTFTQCDDKVCIRMNTGHFSEPTWTTVTIDIDVYQDVSNVRLAVCGETYPAQDESRSGNHVTASVSIYITEQCNGSYVTFHFSARYGDWEYDASHTSTEPIIFAKPSVGPFTLMPAGPFSEPTVTELSTSIEGYQHVSNVRLRVCGETYSGVDESHAGNHVTVSVRINITEKCNGSHITCTFLFRYGDFEYEANHTSKEPIIFAPSTVSESMDRGTRLGHSASSSQPKLRNVNLVKQSHSRNRRGHLRRHSKHREASRQHSGTRY